MSKVEKIEADLQQLSPAELRQVRDWLEDKLQFTPEFERDIRQSEREMEAGLQPRVRKL